MIALDILFLIILAIGLIRGASRGLVMELSGLLGLIVSIFQTVTSIQEQTLTFVPKILSIFVTLMVLGHWMLNEIVVFIENLWSSFSIYIR